MASGWNTEETKALSRIWGAADMQSQPDGVVRNEAIYMKVSAGMAELGYN